MSWFKRWFDPKDEPSSLERTSIPTFDQHVVETLANFTPRAQQALSLARKEAARFNHNFVGTEHVLLGLIALGQGVAVNVLLNVGVNLESVTGEVKKVVGIGPEQEIVGTIPYTPRVKKVLALAAKEARALNHTYVGTEHLLLGLLREGDSVAARVLLDLDVKLEQVRIEILKELDPNFDPPSEPSVESTASKPAAVTAPPPPPKPKTEPVDVAKRYDVYCVERNLQTLVYRNVLFKGVRSLFPDELNRVRAHFFVLEHADRQTVFVATCSVVKFCEPGTTPRAEIFP